VVLVVPKYWQSIQVSTYSHTLLSASPWSSHLHPSLSWVRPLSCPSQVVCAGHAKWQNIKHIKAANDKENAKRNHLYANRIMHAIKSNGDNTDPEWNPALRKVLAEAKAQNVPNATLDKAIKNSKKSGELDTEFVWEMRGPGRVAVIAECLAKKRTVIPIALNPVMKKCGTVQEQGLVNIFEKKGFIVAKLRNGSSLDDAETDGIEAGAEEVEWAAEEQEGLVLYQTDSSHLARVQEALVNLGYTIVEANIHYLPQTTVSLSPIELGVFRNLLEKLSEVDIVTRVHHNAQLQ